MQALDEQRADATHAMSPLARALAMAAPEASAVMDGVAEANAA